MPLGAVNSLKVGYIPYRLLSHLLAMINVSFPWWQLVLHCRGTQVLSQSGVINKTKQDLLQQKLLYVVKSIHVLRSSNTKYIL